jgi:predicted O-methyltransferase YrrM
LNSHGSDKVFAGSIPELYDKYLVPLIFEPEAADLAARLALRPLARVLEIAAGTGVVTRAMASTLPEGVSTEPGPESTNDRPCLALGDAPDRARRMP